MRYVLFETETAGMWHAVRSVEADSHEEACEGLPAGHWMVVPFDAIAHFDVEPTVRVEQVPVGF